MQMNSSNGLMSNEPAEKLTAGSHAMESWIHLFSRWRSGARISICSVAGCLLRPAFKVEWHVGAANRIMATLFVVLAAKCGRGTLMTDVARSGTERPGE